MYSQSPLYRKSEDSLHQGYSPIGVTENAHFENDDARCEYKPRTLIDKTLELLDPTPNIHTLFVQFNSRFFSNVLSSVEVKWSNRMTRCAGTCTFHSRNRQCVISLSVPLLKLRPRSDVVETLLHEMIHGFLFLTNNNRDRDGHGPEFCKHMQRINKIAGTNITIYHSFHAEVRANQHHWWRCSGPCKNRKPFFGMVCRSINRAPGPADFWFKSHQETCGGTFIKVKEPDGYKAKINAKTKKNQNIQSATSKDLNRRISNWFKKSEFPSTPKLTSTPKRSVSTENDKVVNGKAKSNNVTNELYNWTKNGGNLPKTPASPRFSYSGTLGGSNSGKSNLLTKFDALVKNSNNRQDSVNIQPHNSNITTGDFVVCPVCDNYVPLNVINEHIDLCLIKGNTSLHAKPEKVVDNVFVKMINESSSVAQKRKIDTNSPKKVEFNVPANSKKSKFIPDKYMRLTTSSEHFNEHFTHSHEEQNKSVIIVEDSDCDTSINSSIISVNSTSSSELQSESYLKHLEISGNNIDNDNKAKCIVCNMVFPSKALLNDHLNECMGDILDDQFFTNDTSTKETLKNNAVKDDIYPCPHCTELIAISVMNEHLDVCLIK